MPYLLLILALAVVAPLLLLQRKLNRGIQRQKLEDATFVPPVLKTEHAVENLTVLPLVEYHAKGEGFVTEAGVSYLVEAGETRILLDVGANEKGSHPSPLLANANALEIDLKTVDALFISHLHRDHVGGIPQEKEKRFSFSGEENPCGEIPVYSPRPLTGKLPEGCRSVTVEEPMEIAPGVWSMGPMGRSLFLMGYTAEHALAIHVKGRGIALIIGCGHPSIERLLARCNSLFPQPVFAVIGGLHYPIHEGRMMLGPINLQKIVGTDAMPWNGLTEADVERGMAAMQEAGITEVGLSPHDSCDWTLDQFRATFGSSYHEVQVGQPIELGLPAASRIKP